MYRSLKSFSLLCLVLGAVLLFTACGQTTSNTPAANEGTQNQSASGNSESGNSASGNTASGNSSSPASANGSSPQADTADTMTFQAGNGEIQVPKNPQRIVDLTNFYTGYMLKLGVKPAGVMQGAFENPYLKEGLTDTVNLGNEPSPEKIFELNPDLIITFAGSEGIDKLEQIAPVVAFEYGKKNYKDLMIDFGTLTGKEKEARNWVEQWKKKIGELKPQVQAAVGDKTVSILNPYAKGLYVFGHNYGRGGEIIYDEFGLKAPPEAQKEAIDSGTGWASISLEKLPDYAGDIIFTCPWSGDTSDPKIIYDSVIWQGLPAVKAGHVFQLNPDGDTFNDPISLEGQLAFIADALLSVKK